MENFAFQNVFNDNEEEDKCSAIENINNNIINANDEGKKSKGYKHIIYECETFIIHQEKELKC